MVKDILRYKKYFYKDIMGINILLLKMSLYLLCISAVINRIRFPEEMTISAVVVCFTSLILSELFETFCTCFIVNRNFAKGIRKYFINKDIKDCKKLVDLPIYYTEDIDIEVLESLKENIKKLDSKYLSKFIENGYYFKIRKPKRFKELTSFANFNNITCSITLNIGLKYYDFKDENQEQIYTGVRTIENHLTHEFGHYIFDYELKCLGYTKKPYKIFKEEKKKFYRDTYKTKSKILQTFRELKNKDNIIREKSYRYVNSKEFYAENYADYKMGKEVPDKVKEIIESI